jgi:hypothetical protein
MMMIIISMPPSSSAGATMTSVSSGASSHKPTVEPVPAAAATWRDHSAHVSPSALSVGLLATSVVDTSTESNVRGHAPSRSLLTRSMRASLYCCTGSPTGMLSVVRMNTAGVHACDSARSCSSNGRGEGRQGRQQQQQEQQQGQRQQRKRVECCTGTHLQQ